jgi:protease IV
MRFVTLIAVLLLAGCGVPSFLITPVQNTNVLQEIQLEKPKFARGGGKIAVIPVEGMLMNARSGGFLQPTENPLSLFTQELERAEKDNDVKAVVLRVNSPGGTVTTSDAMYQLLLRFREQTRKPVVASCQEVAASGAYYVSCATDRIVAQPTTVVGSIGVIFNTFNLQGTLGKIGASTEAIKSGPLKDMGSPFKALSSEEREVMQGMVNEYYARFVQVLTTNRPVKDSETVKLVTDGRVFSGTRAKELGLIDDTGLLEDAIAHARKMADAPGARVVMYKRPYGYGGSIYADANVPPPQADSSSTLKVELPGTLGLPSGFYYLWNP